MKIVYSIKKPIKSSSARSGRLPKDFAVMMLLTGGNRYAAQETLAAQEVRASTPF